MPHQDDATQSEVCKVCKTPFNVEGKDVIHEAWCLACEKCDLRFTKHEISKSLLGDYLVCENCNLVELVSHYRSQAEKYKDHSESLLTQVNLFKSVLLRPETMAAKADEPLSEQPSIYTIKRRLTGIEHFTIDQLQFWLETYEIYAKCIAETLGQKASKEEIKEHLRLKTEKQLLEGAARQKDLKEKNKVKKDKALKAAKAANGEKVPRQVKSHFDKAADGYMKTLGLSREAAEAMLISMGITKGEIKK